jgi:hypothetical protein
MTSIHVCRGAGAVIVVLLLAVSAFPQTAPEEETIKLLLARLDLDKYKATMKGLAEFGDRQEGTERNRKAVDWIQKQLESYGCLTDRIRYLHQPAATATAAQLEAAATADSPDARLRELNAEPGKPGFREQVFCTKIGTTSSEEMYIIGAHMDGQGAGEAADDNASGAALVMELARIFNMRDVQTERSIRFVLWNNGATGHLGERAYIQQRMDMQGKEDYPGSGNYPEARWLGLINHDMVMWDHGMPRADGSVSAEQRQGADIDIRIESTAKFGEEAAKLALLFRQANEKYVADYPAVVSPMIHTDPAPFMDLIPSISLRENEHTTQIGPGWSPHWHHPTDVYSTYSDKDFRLGLNAAQTTLAAVAQLSRVKLRK